MMRPVRLQLSRKKGFDLQTVSLATNGLPALNVARPGPLGNPFVVGRDGTRAECVEQHRILCSGLMCVSRRATIDAQRDHLVAIAASAPSLITHNVACWCKLTDECHGDTLLEIGRSGVGR